MPRFGRGFLSRQGLGHGLDAAFPGPVQKTKAAAAASFSAKFTATGTLVSTVGIFHKVGAVFATTSGMVAKVGSNQTLKATFVGTTGFKAQFKIAQQIEGAVFTGSTGFKVTLGSVHKITAIFKGTSGFSAGFVGLFPFAPKAAGTLRLISTSQASGKQMVAVMSKALPYSAQDANEIWILENIFGNLVERLF